MSNAIKTSRERTRNLYNDYLRSQQQEREDCTHTPEDDAKTIPIRDYRKYVPGKNEFPDTTYICDRCGAIFDGNLFTAEESKATLFSLLSRFEQIKVLAKLSDKDREFLDQAYAAYHTVEQVVKFYDDVVNKLGDNNGGRKKNRNRNNSGVNLGIRSSSFNRQY